MASEILSQMGWDEGFAIPVADAENKVLEDELKRKQKEKANLENKLGEFEDRIHAMAEHLKNVRQELSHTQALCRAKEKESESEVHLKSLAEREDGRLRQEIQRLENELVALRDKRNIQENNIFKATQRLEDLKCQLNWDHQALEAWLEESARKDEDAMAIVKYAKQDEGKIRELTLRIEKMTVEANQKRKILDNEMTETILSQIELDKIAEDFRKAHIERQDLIHQWENTIEQMQKRDEEMDQCSLLIAKVKQEIREREMVIKEKFNFLQSEVENNKEYEKNISNAERQAAKLRLENQAQETNCTYLKHELNSLKGTVDRTATDLESMRIQLANVKKEIVDKNNKLKTTKEYNEGLVQKLKSVNESTLNVEERAKRMEEMLKEEEQTIKEIEFQLQQLREQQFKRNQELANQKEKEKNTEAEIIGSRTALQNLNSRLHKLDRDSLKQQEMIYGQDFQIQHLGRKMSKLQGELNTDEKLVLEAKVAELNSNLTEKKDTCNMLTTQLKKLEDDIRYVKKELDRTGAEKNELTSKIEELNLFNDISEKELKKIRLKKQDFMVEDNILKLEVKRLRDLLYNKADNVLSLEKRKLQLQAAMKERAEEIKIHRDMLQTQVRIVDQERQKLSAEVQERLSKIDKLRKRYEILMISTAAPEGEEDKSQAYYVIKAAQEKEELQREGDELDAKIRKSEKELRALENTLHVINSRNSTYRKSFQRVTETSEEYEEKLKLDELKRAVEEKYRYKRRQIRELQEDIQGMNSTLDNLLKDEADHHEMSEEAQTKIMNLNKDLEAQKQKLERVTKQAKLPLPAVVSTPSSRHSSMLASARSSASSVRTQISSRSSSGNAGVQSPPMKVVDLGLGLSVTSPPLTTTSPRESRPGSAATSNSSSRSQKSLK
ncbi:coiled-coil domain-containing protein 39 isoform X2 [Polyodon spathula]|uniref:coiled-coil domain-containing protein 39 isoform X2 n=1 Tax=Polyodon spathula TaxID=7913 RepID=UPI001B7E9DC0|nr:coiled-coil domain-containing protein 39 isoform X2 [Polyodon spathula]